MKFYPYEKGGGGGRKKFEPCYKGGGGPKSLGVVFTQ